MTTNENNDLLDTNVSDIDTSFPRIVAATYDLRVKELELKPNNAQTGNNIAVVLETTSNTTDTEGKPVASGFTIRHNISLVKTEKYDPNKAVATFMKCFKLTGSPKAFADNPNMALGAVGACKVKIQKATDQFGERNAIAQFEQKS